MRVIKFIWVFYFRLAMGRYKKRGFYTAVTLEIFKLNSSIRWCQKAWTRCDPTFTAIVFKANNTISLNFKLQYDRSIKSRGGSWTAATSKMEHFVIIVNRSKPLTIITKCSILDVAAVLDLLTSLRGLWGSSFRKEVFNI